MIRAFKDTYKVSLFLATIFLMAVLVSAYMLYSLSVQLQLSGGFEEVFSRTYGAFAAAFLSGGLALYLALKSRRELIVYKERSEENALNNKSDDDSQKSSVSLNAVKAVLHENASQSDLLKNFIQSVCKELQAGQGALYLASEDDGIRKVVLESGYALHLGESAELSFEFGEGLVGQAAAEGRALYIDDIPEGYIKIISGLGSSSPRYLLIAPVKRGDTVVGVMEVASFTPLNSEQRKFAEEAATLIAEKVSMEENGNNIASSYE